jgi:hypothetical protein
MLEELERRRHNFELYGTVESPDDTYLMTWNEDRFAYDFIRIGDIVEAVNIKINQLQAQRNKDVLFQITRMLRRENSMINVRVR